MLHFRCFLVFRGKTKCKIMNRRKIALICCILMGCLACLAQNVVEVKKPGTLGSLLTQEQQDTCTTLILQGKLNSSDIRLLRCMGGYTEDGKGTGRLERIDMQNVVFVTDKEPYMTLEAAKENLVAYTQNVHSPSLSAGYNMKGYAGYVPYAYESSKQSYIPQVYLSKEKPDGLYIYNQKGWKRRADESIAYFKANFILHANPEFGTKPVWTPEDKTGAIVSFARGRMSKEDWRKIKKYNLKKTKGHRLTMENGECYWNAYTCKDYISLDIFYGCPSIKEVILPRNVKCAGNIHVNDLAIRYIKPEDEQFLNNLDKFNKKRKQANWFNKIQPR